LGTLLTGDDYRSKPDPRPPARRALDKALSERKWQEKVMGRARELHYRLMVHFFPGQFSNGRWLTNVNREGLGFCDLLCLRPPVMVALELKTEAKKPTEEQALWLDGFAAMPGCVAMYARPRDWEVVSDVLARPWAYLPEPERWALGPRTEGASHGAGV